MRPSSARPTAGAASRWASSSSVSCARSARNSIAPMPSARGPPCATSRARPRLSYPARFGLDQSVVAKAGLQDFRFHDLRHTAASHLIMRGASLSDVKEILGHADLKMTMRYAHLSPAHLRGAVDRLDGLTDRGPHPTAVGSPKETVATH